MDPPSYALTPAIPLIALPLNLAIAATPYLYKDENEDISYLSSLGYATLFSSLGYGVASLISDDGIAQPNSYELAGVFLGSFAGATFGYFRSRETKEPSASINLFPTNDGVYLLLSARF